MFRPISNAPHVSRAAAFLDSRQMVENPIHVFEKYRAALGPTFTFHFGGAKKAVVSTDPAFNLHILKTNKDNYVKSHIQTQHMVEFQGVGLVNSHGPAWLRQRSNVEREVVERIHSRRRRLQGPEVEAPRRDWAARRGGVR